MPESAFKTTGEFTIAITIGMPAGIKTIDQEISLFQSRCIFPIVERTIAGFDHLALIGGNRDPGEVYCRYPATVNAFAVGEVVPIQKL